MSKPIVFPFSLLTSPPKKAPPIDTLFPTANLETLSTCDSLWTWWFFLKIENKSTNNQWPFHKKLPGQFLQHLPPFTTFLPSFLQAFPASGDSEPKPKILFDILSISPRTSAPSPSSPPYPMNPTKLHPPLFGPSGLRNFRTFYWFSKTSATRPSVSSYCFNMSTHIFS